MWTVEQWVAIAGVAALLLTAVAGIIKAVVDLIVATRKKDTTPAPQLGIPAAPSAPDDIDYRAYLDMKKRAEKAERQREELLQILTRRSAGTDIDEDTHPLDPKESP